MAANIIVARMYLFLGLNMITDNIPINPNIMLLPKSGWIKTNKTGIAIINKAQIYLVISVNFVCCDIPAKNNIKDNLANSEICNTNGPKANHRLDPLIGSLKISNKISNKIVSK